MRRFFFNTGVFIVASFLVIACSGMQAIAQPSPARQTLVTSSAPIVLGSKAISVFLDVRSARSQLNSIAVSGPAILFLELKGVEADHQPGVIWEVYVGLPVNAAPNPKSPYYVGNVALFGTGVRSDALGQFNFASFKFRINKSALASLQSNSNVLRVTFVPTGILIHGKPSHPKVTSPVRIGQLSVMVEWLRP